MSTNNIKTIATSDYLAVIETMNAYVEGLRLGKSERVRDAFRDEATMYGFAAGELVVGGPISNLYEFVDKGGPAPELVAHLDILSMAPTIAVVRADMEQDSVGGAYTDFHTLIKQHGQWRIVSKVYHQYGG